MSYYEILTTSWRHLRPFLEYADIIRLQSTGRRLGLWLRAAHNEEAFMLECMNRTWGLLSLKDIDREFWRSHVKATERWKFRTGLPPLTYEQWPTKTNLAVMHANHDVHVPLKFTTPPQTWLEINLLLDHQEAMAYDPFPVTMTIDNAAYRRTELHGERTIAQLIWKMRNLSRLELCIDGDAKDRFLPRPFIGYCIYKQSPETKQCDAMFTDLTGARPDNTTREVSVPFEIDWRQIYQRLGPPLRGVPLITRFLLEDPNIRSQFGQDPLDRKGSISLAQTLGSDWIGRQEQDRLLEDYYGMLQVPLGVEIWQARLRATRRWDALLRLPHNEMWNLGDDRRFTIHKPVWVNDEEPEISLYEFRRNVSQWYEDCVKQMCKEWELLMARVTKIPTYALKTTIHDAFVTTLYQSGDFAIMMMVAQNEVDLHSWITKSFESDESYDDSYDMC
eukprot:Blabericola_migrator_1__6269@NODE_3162_length_1988_cov_157_294638_g1980_i0_p1_GENE_NODE_3162_length_1988_cov_157_294638_g1980_i0NODE_3162_length_1988_cov_157_294638_g1980_i0_p1_ORF_typecomplete_len447_score62_01_NODE_3162_length_1988_cov_157_294638_g1980_i04151755